MSFQLFVLASIFFSLCCAHFFSHLKAKEKGNRVFVFLTILMHLTSSNLRRHITVSFSMDVCILK